MSVEEFNKFNENPICPRCRKNKTVLEKNAIDTVDNHYVWKNDEWVFDYNNRTEQNYVLFKCPKCKFFKEFG